MKSLFLICALALHPANFGGHDLIREIEQIRDFVQEHYPGAKLRIVPSEQRPKSPPWERVPFTWQGMEIWIRRKTIKQMETSA